MASAQSQKPTCPECNQADKVKTMQAAYDSGVTRCAPPDMPMRNVPMFKPIAISVVLVAICVFLIIVLLGGMEAHLDPTIAIVLVGLTLAVTVLALVLSYIAFQRVVKGDNEAALRFPAWDKAMERWNSLYYCARDNVVFDPGNGHILNDAELVRIRAYDELEVRQEMAATARQA